MKKYRTYTAKKYKIVRKIIFFAIVAVAIFGATVIWGNILKNKIENTEVPPPLDVETTAPEENKDEQKGEAGVSHDEALSKVKAGCLDLSLMTDIQSARGAVDALKAGGYNCVSFNVTDKEGKLTYASPGVVQDSRLPAKETLISYEVLKATSEYAKGLSMRLSCVIVASESFSDQVVAGELAALGFDEIVVRGFERYTLLSNEYVEEIRDYVLSLREASGSGAQISIAFAPELYTTPNNAPYIEKVYNFCEFLAIDMTDFSEGQIGETALKLQGSFTAYMLRPILSGEDPERVQKTESALSEHSVTSRQYVSTPEREAPKED